MPPQEADFRRQIREYATTAPLYDWDGTWR